MNAHRETVFEHVVLSNATGYVSSTVSCAVPVQGNTVIVDAMLTSGVNLGTDKIVLTLEGSYDGRTWMTTGLSISVDFRTNGPEPLTSSAVTVDYAFLRVRAAISSGTNVAGLFSLDLVFTAQ